MNKDQLTALFHNVIIGAGGLVGGTFVAHYLTADMVEALSSLFAVVAGLVMSHKFNA